MVSDLLTDCVPSCSKEIQLQKSLPSEIYSDNESNFKGASNKLKTLYQFLSTDSTQRNIQNYLLSHQTTWSFSPERAPHFGGLWEVAVKSTKHHLRRVIGQQTLTYDEFYTITCQIECSLNSQIVNLYCLCQAIL